MDLVTNRISYCVDFSAINSLVEDLVLCRVTSVIRPLGTFRLNELNLLNFLRGGLSRGSYEINP